MGNKEYIESGGIDESADEGDDKYEENALYADRIVPMLTGIGAHDDLLWDVPMEWGSSPCLNVNTLYHYFLFNETKRNCGKYIFDGIE